MKAAGIAGKILGKKGVLILIVSILPIFFLIGVVTSSTQMITTILIGGEEEENKNDAEIVYEDCPVSPEVEALREEVLNELKKYGKEAYINLVLALIMQESGGRCEDVFQCSESLGKAPNSIGRKESIEHGVKVLCNLLDHEKVKVQTPLDIDHIKIALQAYNYGSGYINYINDTSGFGNNTPQTLIDNIGKWTQENALAYQKKMSAASNNGCPVPRTGASAKTLGPYKYGDAYYTEHVLRYYQRTEIAKTGSKSSLTDQEIKDITDKINDTQAKSACTFALTKVGYPYSQPKRDSGEYFDCSSLAFYSWKYAGINISYDNSNVAAAEAHFCAAHGKVISESQMQPGDLIFYSYEKNGRYKNISHVGIYVGDGKMVEAYNEEKGVIFTDYHNGSLVMIGRPHK
jgi:cell wall-associated NlpC family hydrolase